MPLEGTALVRIAGRNRQSDGSALQPEPSNFPYRTWLPALLICALAAAASFVYFDVPTARRVYGLLGPAKGLATGFASAVLLAVEACVALGLVILRIVHGRLSPFREATVLACLTSICAYAINDSTLKVLFGVPNPWAVLHGSRHAFNFLHGSSGSSFPSGHMVIASAFGGVFMRLYRASIWPLSALLLVAAVLLIVGNWHFISDVIAGTYLGLAVGVLAGETWLAHSGREPR
jgi:membrane-associated phospholipid phosphatase